MTRRAYTTTAVIGLCVTAVVIASLIALWAQGRVRAQVYASGFTAPVAFVQDPLDRTVQFVVEQAGRIRVVRSGTVLPTDFLDLRAAVAAGGERGLLGLAFPRDAASGRFYVNFTDRSGDTVVARFRRSTDALVADPSSRFDLRFNGGDGEKHEGAHVIQL